MSMSKISRDSVAQLLGGLFGGVLSAVLTSGIFLAIFVKPIFSVMSASAALVIFVATLIKLTDALDADR